MDASSVRIWVPLAHLAGTVLLTQRDSESTTPPPPPGQSMQPASSVLPVNRAEPGKGARGDKRPLRGPLAAASSRRRPLRPSSHAWQLQALPRASRGRAGTGAGRARLPVGRKGGRGDPVREAHLPHPAVNVGARVALLSSWHRSPRPSTPGSPLTVGAIGARCARWPEMSPPRRQRRPSIRAGTDATHASRPAPSPLRLLQGDTQGRWHARRRRGLRQGGDAGRGGTGSLHHCPVLQSDSWSQVVQVLGKTRRAAIRTH